MERNSFLIVAKSTLVNKKISTTGKLLLAQLLDHRNKKTGQCNPGQVKLAEELGISVDTVQRGLHKLCKLGLITIHRGQYGCRYEIQIPQPAVSQTANPRIPKPQPAVPSVPGPLYEPYINEPSVVRGQNRPAPAGSFPNKKSFNTTLPPRKSAQSETLEAYYRKFGDSRARRSQE